MTEQQGWVQKLAGLYVEYLLSGRTPIQVWPKYMESDGRIRKRLIRQLVENGYMKVQKVFDSQGNEPGKPSAAPQVQGNGNWNTNTPGTVQQAQPSTNAWSAGPSAAQQQQPQQSAQPQQSGKPAWAS